MTTALVLNTSVLGEASASRQLVADAVSRLRAADPALKVISRDLVTNPVPHLTPDSAAIIRGATPANAAQAEALALADELVAELKAADIVLIAAPMYNFGMPTSLRAWFDYVLRAGVTFRYTESGPEGLLPGKRAIVVETRGGFYSEGPTVPLDSQEPHLRTLLSFMGITDITFVRAEKLGFGPEARAASVTAAQEALRDALAKAPAAV